MKKITRSRTSNRHALRERRKIQNSLRIHRRVGDKEGEAKDWFRLGEIDLERDRREKACRVQEGDC